MTAGAEPMLNGKRLADASGFDLALPQSVVLVFDEGLVPRSRLRSLKSTDPRPFRSVAAIDAGVAVVAAMGPGAPVAAVTVELLAALGVRQIVSVGTAGRLSASGQDPSLHLAERAVSDEGTSVHYGATLVPDHGLLDLLHSLTGASKSVTLTTDVPFRHTADRLAQHRNQAELVEMEVAAIYAAAHHHRVAAASLLVISDEFGTSDWEPIAGPEVTAMLSTAVQTACQALSQR